jgi:hypothetical protein
LGVAHRVEYAIPEATHHVAIHRARQRTAALDQLTRDVVKDLGRDGASVIDGEPESFRVAHEQPSVARDELQQREVVAGSKELDNPPDLEPAIPRQALCIVTLSPPLR